MIPEVDRHTIRSHNYNAVCLKTVSNRQSEIILLQPRCKSRQEAENEPEIGNAFVADTHAKNFLRSTIVRPQDGISGQ